MFVNVRAFQEGTLVFEVNPYDEAVGTLKGMPGAASLSASEAYLDELVYETHTSSSLSEETETFHFALADNRYKDNRIPPKGFRIGEASSRLAQPRWHGQDALDYFTVAEYQGGYDEVSLGDLGVWLPYADLIEISLYYQTTSREYVRFLRDEINGTGITTLPELAYLAQTDDFFTKLAAWGDTIWQLWEHNKGIPGAAPVLMAQESIVTTPCQDPGKPTVSAQLDGVDIILAWNSLGAGVDYAVHQAPVPYFTLTDTTLLTVTTNTMVKHQAASGDAATNHYYQIQARSCQEAYLNNSNRVGEVDFALISGTK